MAVRGEWPRDQSSAAGARTRTITKTGGATRTSGVEVAKIHVEPFNLPSPVTRTPEIYHPLRTVADHPTGVDIAMTESLGNRRRKVYASIEVKYGECARARYIDLAIGQPPVTYEAYPIWKSGAAIAPAGRRLAHSILSGPDRFLLWCTTRPRARTELLHLPGAPSEHLKMAAPIAGPQSRSDAQSAINAPSPDLVPSR